jgi:outer membrane lipoprotein SlyB
MLAACAVSPPDSTLAFRPGVGTVESVRPARVALPPQGSGAIAGSEAARGSYGTPVERVFRPRWTEGYQLTLQMADGSTQQVTQDNAAFQVGDRVQVTPEGRVVKIDTAAMPAPAAAAPAPATYRPGLGTVESASVVSLPSSPSATAGGTTARASQPTMAYRLRMADGSTQNVMVAGERLNVGERVELTRDGRLVRP